MNYVEAKRLFVEVLSRDATAHEAGRYEEIGAGYDRVDRELPRDVSSEFDQLYIALEFWSGWIDARNHNWQYYKGIKESDWPVLARSIVQSLEADEEIREPIILSHFDFRNLVRQKGLIARLVDRLRDRHK
jgi:hypothetical protein